MTGVSAVSSVNDTNAGGVSLSGGAARPSESLLVPPADGVGASDALSMIYLLESKDRGLTLQKGKRDIQTDQKERDEALRQEIEQIQKAAEAAKHHGFWDDVGNVCLTIGKVAAVVGSIAVAVVSCGAGTAVAALVIVGCLMSTAGFAEGQFHVLEKLGVDPETANWVGVGLSVGGMVASCGAGLLTSGAEVASEAASTAQDVASTADKAATVVSCAGHVTGGVAKVEASHYSAQQEDRRADALSDEQDAFLLARQIQMLIDRLAGDDKSSQRNLGYVRSAMEAGSAASAAAVMRV
jgi:hypothetical protein